ncbi:SDR family oxidoreductase [Nostoc sp. ChiQUE01b]|uniref:SDR family oxidoreductase n=1 Tax=Nostoc sp. ChiQUE01b TaxID=3075376 RepID=UPI002AD48C4C|nr:SDR family oxidoreductase [Nostoc sp. ChiQUE01b]MDZ8261477.1 SDR family oxidoreductase [Nostoc sp. ChiQUE01b]
MDSSVDNLTNKTGLEIAVIGMNGYFPEAQNIERFWQNLRDGVESIHFFTDQELKDLGVDSADLTNPYYVKAEGVVEDIDLFDASFFGINPREAETMDPGLRLFLEYAWTALEDAGYSFEAYNKPIGVFAGFGFGGYLPNIYSNPDIVDSVGQYQIEKGISPASITLASYKLNLQGPSYAVQTTCSSSLVALHLACQSLLSGECDVALVGGVSISEAVGYVYQEGGTSSPDGHCRAFDAKAKGCPRGTGLGIVVLKLLEEAIADGDCIHAVIKGSAINNDGSDKVSYTAPSIHGQATVIRAAQIMAEVEPETITYIEAHGTGTALGDPVEIAALTQAFQTKTQKKGFCAIGSLKTNIGHLDEAAGVASIIKTVLALKHKQIPPSLNFEEPSPQIDFANSPFYVNNTLSEWKTNGTPRRAGVSAFGFGGTNAHVILEEAPIIKPSSPSRTWQLLLLSTKTSTALETATENIANYLQKNPDLNLADVAHTLQVGRWTLNHRRIVVCQNQQDAIKALQDPQRAFTHYQEPCNRSVVFMFSGQGTQYVNMARELYESETVFREQVDCCCELLKPHLEVDLRTVLYPNEKKALTAAQKLQQTAITQPALFVIEYALAKLWMAWGVRPETMIGHGVGEYVAATVAGVFSLEDALGIVANRGKLMQQLPGGAMLSVQLPEQEVQQLLEKGISLAASNAPSSCVVSGSTEAIDQLQQKLQQRGVSCRRLHTNHAFHSQMMEPIIETFTRSLQKVKLNPPKIPFVSNVSGTWITAAEAADPNYWATHLRQPVRFSQGVTELLKQPERILLEVSPGQTLSNLAKQHQTDELIALTSIRHPQEQQSDVAFLLNTLGKLWVVGVQIDWSGFYIDEKRHRVPLPTYPFERQRYWLEVNRNVPLATIWQKTLDLDEKPDIADWFYIPRWKQSTPLELFQKEKLVEQKSCWLVFVDSYGVGVGIAERLKQQGQDVIIIKVADDFAKLSDFIYTINPQQRDDYDALLQALREQNWTPQAIAHLWSVTPNDTLPNQELDEQTQNQFFEDCQNLGFYSLLFLTQALAEQNIIEPIKLVVVTNNVYDVTGSENLCPEKATILGPCKVIPQEYPNINCCCFDVVLPGYETKPSHKTAKLIDYLLAEFVAQPTENVVAYRGHHRWIQTYEPIRLDESIVGRKKLRKEGVYLITGGLGGVGLVLAEYLAQTVQAKLILLGRKGLPEKDQWQEWLATHDQQDSISRKIRKVQALLALGAEVLVISADVANEQQMHNVIAIATKRFGGINGVIHAAGNAEHVHCTIMETSKAEAQSQFHPKVYGLFVLEKVLQGQELDFCQLTSSLASVLGGLGFISYSAANIFMDAFVHNYNKTNSFAWSSFNWDDWVTEEEQQNTSVLETLYKYGMRSKTASIDAFERLLSMCGFPQIVVSTGDLQARVEEWIKLESLQTKELSNNENLFSKHQRPNLGIEYLAPRNEAEETVANIWQEILGIECIGIDDNFFELGGNSINAIQIAAKANKTGLKLTPKQFFEHQTIAELVTDLGITQTIQPENNLETKELYLTPIQHWLFAQNQPDPHNCNQSLLLEMQKGCDRNLLEQALQHLIEHHDVFRLRFIQKESAWQQVYASSNDTIELKRVDLSALPEIERKFAIESVAAELEASLNLFEGPLVRFAFFDLVPQQTSYLLIIIHHLAVDSLSWQILLEDLQTVYQQISQGKAIHLPDYTTSYMQWTQCLQGYAESSEMMREQDYWLQEIQKPFSRLPVDYSTGDNTVANADIVSVCLNKQETKTILEEIHKAYNTQINDVLLTALMQAFATWTGEQTLWVDIRGNGREKTFKDVNIFRTVGSFTTCYPVILDTREFSESGNSLIAIKEYLRGIPNSGIGYSLLEYLSSEQEIESKLRVLPQTEVSFNYLGQYDQMISKSSLFCLPQESKGLNYSTPANRFYLLELNGIVVQEQLQLHWTYSKAIHRRETIEKLADDFIKALRSLIIHCQSLETAIYTPSDFPKANLSKQKLDQFLAKITQKSQENTNESRKY